MNLRRGFFNLCLKKAAAGLIWPKYYSSSKNITFSGFSCL